MSCTTVSTSRIGEVVREREQKRKMWCQNGNMREACRQTDTQREQGKGKRHDRQLRKQER